MTRSASDSFFQTVQRPSSASALCSVSTGCISFFAERQKHGLCTGCHNCTAWRLVPPDDCYCTLGGGACIRPYQCLHPSRRDKHAAGNSHTRVPQVSCLSEETSGRILAEQAEDSGMDAHVVSKDSQSQHSRYDSSARQHALAPMMPQASQHAAAFVDNGCPGYIFPTS